MKTAAAPQPVEVRFIQEDIKRLPALLPIRAFGRFFGFRRDLLRELERLPGEEIIVIPFAPKQPKEVESMRSAIANSLPLAQKRTGTAWRMTYNKETKQFLIGRREEWAAALNRKEKTHAKASA